MARNCRTGVSIRTGGRGPAGPQGPQGPQGPVGPEGPQGPEGTGNTGSQGPTGSTGVDISSAAVQGDFLIITLSDGTTIDAGNVRGPDGEASARGATGNTGPAGATGVTGIGFNISNTYRLNLGSIASCTVVGGVGGFLTDGVGVTHGEFKLEINDGSLSFQSRARFNITENNLDDVSKAAVLGITGNEQLFVQIDNLVGTKSYSYIFSAPDRITETAVDRECSIGDDTNISLTLPSPFYNFDGKLVTVLGESPAPAAGPFSQSAFDTDELVNVAMFRLPVGVTGPTGPTGPAGSTGATGATGGTGAGYTGVSLAGAPGGYTLSFRELTFTGGLGGTAEFRISGFTGGTGNTGNTGVTGTGFTFQGMTSAGQFIEFREIVYTSGAGVLGATFLAGPISGPTGGTGVTGNTGNTGAGYTGVSLAGAPGGYTLSFRELTSTGGLGGTFEFVITGATGTTGATGATGNTGNTGNEGSIGPAGAVGFMYQENKSESTIQTNAGKINATQTGITASSRYIGGNTFNNTNYAAIIRGAGEYIYLLGASGNTGHRIYRANSNVAIDSFGVGDVATRISNLTEISTSAVNFPTADAYVSLLVVPAGLTGPTGGGFTGAGISLGNLVVRPVLAGAGALGATLNLGRVIGATGPVVGHTGNYLFQNKDGLGTSGSTALHYDFDGRGGTGLAKLDLYREKIFNIGSIGAASPTITINAHDGPIQRVNLTGLSSEGTSQVAFSLNKASWNSGQGVTVIIEHNVSVSGTSPTTAATWSDGDSSHKYNATPQLLPDRTTMVYVVGYNESDAPGTVPSTYYITSQTFGTL